MVSETYAVSKTFNGLSDFMTLSESDGLSLLTLDLDIINSTSYCWNLFLQRDILCDGLIYTVTIEIEDEKTLATNEYYFQLFIIDSTETVFNVTQEEEEEEDWFWSEDGFTGKITEFSDVGLMTIKFSTLLFPVIDISQINGTFVDLYVVPASNRELEEDFTNASVNFTWSVVYMEEDIMQI